MHLSQMAHRCPESIFKGKATLAAYRWHINERGVANVVESTPDSSVEGLLYLVSPKDERALDRSEGVASGLYQKHLLNVTFEPHEQYSDFKTSPLSQMLAQLDLSGAQASNRNSQYGSTNIHESSADGPMNPRDEWSWQQPPYRAHQIRVLVYVSENYVTDGTIREEYISRMQSAISDAKALGVSVSFIDKFIVPCLNPSDVRQPTPKESPEIGETPEQSQVHEAKPPTPEQTEVDLHRLRQDNRQLRSDSNVSFPTQLLDEMADMSAGSTGSTGSTGSQLMVYLVLKQAISAGSPRLSIEAAAHDLELANELAMRHFRDHCSQDPVLKVELIGCLTRSEVWNAHSRDLEWELDENHCLHLGVDVPENGSQVNVWVYAQVVSESIQ
jgi:hypothetical protein